MARGAVASEGSGGEAILHFGAVRMRITGFGNLKMKMMSLDEYLEHTIQPLQIAIDSNIQPTRLCNFKQQRAQFELATEEINEFIRVNRIIIFAKEIYTDFPSWTAPTSV